MPHLLYVGGFNSTVSNLQFVHEIKGKRVLIHSTEANRGREGIIPLLLNLDTRGK